MQFIQEPRLLKESVTALYKKYVPILGPDNDNDGFPWDDTVYLHIYIYIFMYHKDQQNVGKYSRHRSYGSGSESKILPSNLFDLRKAG